MRKVLIANRGEIARRIARTCREMGIRTVAIYSEADRDAAHAVEADEAVALGGNSAAESYLNGEAIVDAARRTGAHAVHPGYGFLSENAAFAQQCKAAGLTFIGPTPEAIGTMGDKIRAKECARKAGVPVLETVEVSSETAKHSLPASLALPVMVKAAAGGGGRGMRVVHTKDALGESIAAARREAGAAFGDDTVYLERYLERARHIEVQIIGDTEGNVRHLYERECSIQRRHQKIFEEAPSPAFSVEPLTHGSSEQKALWTAAVRIGESVGYMNAGTVEFLLLPDGSFYFLEMNTRLQVEHPVTECVTGVDLVRWQIEIAYGESLPPQEAIPPPEGHAIEVRLYAEDPLQEYAPGTGQLDCVAWPDVPGVRIDSGVKTGDTISPYYDAMIAKVIAFGPHRREAIDRLSLALQESKVHGVKTNRDLLLAICEEREFRQGATDTQYLKRHPVRQLVAGEHVESIAVSTLAAAIAEQSAHRLNDEVWSSIASGWRNVRSEDQFCDYCVSGRDYHVSYDLTKGCSKASVNGKRLESFKLHSVIVDSSDPSRSTIDMTVEGIRRRYAVLTVSKKRYVDSLLGSFCLERKPRYPARHGVSLGEGSLSSPMPGKVVRVLASVDDRVEQGQTLLVIEAMKMEHSIRASRPGIVRNILAEENQQVEAGTALVLIDPLESSDENTNTAEVTNERAM